jgi:hypothetical protein
MYRTSRTRTAAPADAPCGYRHLLREPFLNLTFVSNGAEGAGGPLVFMPNILYVASSQRTDAVARLTLSNSLPLKAN